MRNQLRGPFAILADNSRFWGTSAGLFAVLAILKGLRLPSLWAATQAFLDYRTGIIKRGLLGQGARALAIPIGHYDVFVMVSGVLLLAFCVLLLCWIRTSGVRRLAQGSVLAVFAASFILSFLAQLIGYLEIPAAILGLAALSASTARWRLAAILVAGVAGVLIHENYVLTFLPVTLLPAFLSAASGRNLWHELMPVAVVSLLVAAVVLAVALGASMTAEQVETLQAAMSASVDFQPRGDFFPVLTRSMGCNILLMLEKMTTGAWWFAQGNAFLVFMPTTAFFLWLALQTVDTSHQGINRRWVKCAVVLAGLCPLAMQFIGWDIYRWYALAGFNSFLVLTVVYFHYRGREPVLNVDPQVIQNLAVLLIAVNLATGTGLFDGNHVDTFPFVDHWRALMDWLSNGRHWPQPAA
jgi:hypothetical protein